MIRLYHIISYKIKDTAISQKIILALVAILFFSCVSFAKADVIINEIQIKPTGESFVELYNSGVSQDLTDWSIKRKTSSGIEYPLVSTSRLKDKTILANSYFLLTNESDYTGSITSDVKWAKSYNLANDNTVLLYNSNEEVVSKSGWGNASDCNNSCPPNPAEGQSIQKTGDNWVSATPTPGLPNEIIVSPPPEPSPPSGGTASSGSGTTEVKPKVIEEQKIKTQIISKTLGIVGIPVTFDGKVYGPQGEKLYSGKVFWNFGDGDSKEIQLNYNQPFTHTYFYPGEYTVSFFFYSNYYSDIVDASSQVTIKIIPASVTISRVGDEKDFFVELSNDTDYGIDISNWFLISNDKSFVIPKNTILSSKKKMIISPRITGFSILDKNNLKLMTPQRDVVFDFMPTIVTPIFVKEEYSKKVSKANTNITNTAVTAKLSDILPATAIASDLTQDENKVDTNSFPIFPVISAIFIGASAYGVYFVRKRKVVSGSGEDFEILDE